MPAVPSRKQTEAILSRRTDLDWLRIIAFGLLIFYHVGCFYMLWPWHANSHHATWDVARLLEITQPWRLVLLFVISGVATRFMLDKMSTGAFLASRATRLLIPLAFAMLVIVPPQTYVALVEQAGYRGSFASFYFPDITGTGGWSVDKSSVTTPEWAHMWFIAYLFVFTVVAAIVGPTLKALPARKFAPLITGPWLIIVPMAAIGIALLLLTKISTPNHGLIGDWRSIVVYGGTFLFGYAIAKHEAFFVASQRYRYIALAIAVAAYLAVQVAHQMGMYEGLATRYFVLHSIFKAIQGWAAVIAAFGFARRYLRRDGPVRRYLTDAVFPYFIIHQTAIVVAGHCLTGMNLPVHIEAPALIIITIASCVVGYEIIRRIWLLRPLFGLKLEPRAPKEPEDTAPRPI